jgi:hypothetical protein
VALSTQTANRRLDALAPVTMPPMLWRSWPLLIAASNDRPELVPVATWRRAMRLLPLRPFLVWEQREATSEAEAVLRSWKTEVGSQLAASAPPRRPARDMFTAGAAASEAATGSAPVDSRRDLSMQVLAPRAAIDELAGMARSAGEENP